MRRDTLRKLLLDSRDGEWGKSDAGPGRVRMRVIRGTDFSDIRIGDFKNVPTRYLEQRHADRKRLQENDILIETAGGTADQPTGRTVLVTRRALDALDGDVTCASFARFLRINKESADPRFVFWLLQYHYAQRHLQQFHLQHTGVARFQFTTFADTFELELPDPDVQLRIASVLGAYDDAIEVNRRRIALLEEMAGRLFEEWFVRLRFPGHGDRGSSKSDPEAASSGWRVGKVRELVERQRNGRVYRASDCEQSGPVIVIDQSSEEMLGYHSNDPDHDATPEEPIVIFGDHTCKMQLLVSPFSIGPNTIAFKAKGPENIYYLFSLVRGLTETKEYKRHWNELMNNEVRIAPPELTLEYANKVRPLFQLEENLQRQIRVLRGQRELLIPRLVSGGLSTANAERELEAVA